MWPVDGININIILHWIVYNSLNQYMYLFTYQVELKEKYKVRIFMDESMSFGTVGDTGKGVTEYFNIPVCVFCNNKVQGSSFVLW